MSNIDIIRQYFAKEAGRPELGEQDSLLEGGILDSLAIVKLIAFLEERFGVELSDDEFDPDNFETIATISELIRHKQASA